MEKAIYIWLIIMTSAVFGEFLQKIMANIYYFTDETQWLAELIGTAIAIYSKKKESWYT